jgi:hypothetical protein
VDEGAEEEEGDAKTEGEETQVVIATLRRWGRGFRRMKWGEGLLQGGSELL